MDTETGLDNAAREKAVDAILSELFDDRCGLSDAWDEVDEATQEDIRQELILIVKRHIG